ncbi:MAG: Xaa-Pro peptidase family protein [Candidatus Promineifilaceae bacterium]|nr:Xaa-Pro peptidase family protein [Candidatus Promineifilaceae bacterium]
MVSGNNNDVAERVEAVREKLAEWEVDAFLISGPASRRWLSGFTGSAGWLLITPSDAWLGTDFRYWEQADQQAPSFTVYRLTAEKRLPTFVSEVAEGMGAEEREVVIGVEAEQVTLAELEQLEEAEGIVWKPLSSALAQMRAIKSETEIATMKRAATITDEVMGAVPLLARVGQSEKELAWLLEKRLREAGADGVAFPVTVASGPNAALPHHSPSERRLEPGDALIVDMGAVVDGYKSDLTRTFYMGAEADEQFWKIYRLVLEAQQAALAALKVGAHNRAVDAAARDLIASGGHGEHFGHGLGHGVGLEIHEAPRLSPRAEEAETVDEGVVITVEPGIYIPGWGGVRIEDLVRISASGVEFLSHCPKEPLIPPV